MVAGNAHQLYPSQYSERHRQTTQPGQPDEPIANVAATPVRLARSMTQVPNRD